MTQSDFFVKSLGKPGIKTPLRQASKNYSPVFKFVEDHERIIYDTSLDNFNKCKVSGEIPISFEKAGPHENIFFEPAKTKAAIVTCGGLCPGLNNVIRSIVNELYYRYGVTRVLGIKYGYEGLISKYNHPVIELTAPMVSSLHLVGGTALGSSRGNQDIGEIVDTLEMLNINILFCIGGDGTLRGAHAIHEEIEKRKLKIGVAGIPKTIDNDINLIDKFFDSKRYNKKCTQ
jgi:6-phosphofructokinase 1